MDIESLKQQLAPAIASAEAGEFADYSYENFIQEVDAAISDSESKISTTKQVQYWYENI